MWPTRCNLRRIAEMILVGNVFADHVAIHRWAIKALQVLAVVRRFLERTIKRITRPILDVESFWGAKIINVGSETMHMIRKGQLNCPSDQAMSRAQQFFSLAA